LTHPSYERNDCGLNHILAKLATKNGVAIEINFREILISSKRTRAQVMKNFKDIIKLHKKFKFPLVVCSGAISHFEICDPFVLSSLLNLLGLGLKEAKDSVSKIPSKIINTALEKKKSVLPGVRMVK
jgi:ribonuclease P/MRP protein subunit RPP1